MIEVLLDSVRVHKEPGKYVVLLREKDGARYVPLWVGQAEADAVAWFQKQVPVNRPQPHDLTLAAIDRLGGKCTRGAITELKDGTYYAKLVVEQGSQQLELDARPSDAVNVALRPTSRSSLRNGC